MKITFIFFVQYSTAGCSFGGVDLNATSMLLLAFYTKRRRRTQSSHKSASEVEKFLREYAYEKPTRYSNSQLKKITNNFPVTYGTLAGNFNSSYIFINEIYEILLHAENIHANRCLEIATELT